MILQYLVMLGMIAFCVWRLIVESGTPGPVYIPLIYIICPVLLVVGLGKRGVVTWPLATILLLLEGHWIIGWVPAALVTFTVLGNVWLDKRYPTTCAICGEPFEDGEEVLVDEDNRHVHSGACPASMAEGAPSQDEDESST